VPRSSAQAARTSPIAPFSHRRFNGSSKSHELSIARQFQCFGSITDTERFAILLPRWRVRQHSDPLFIGRRGTCFLSELSGSYREVGIPRMERISWRALTSRGERGGLSSQIIKSANLTSCSTRTSATDTFTVLAPCAIPATHSLPRSAARPRATASYSVAAVTSTVCETPSRSWIVTRQERIGTSEKITYSLFIRHKGRTSLRASPSPGQDTSRVYSPGGDSAHPSWYLVIHRRRLGRIVLSEGNALP